MKRRIREFFEKKENLYLTLALFFGLVMVLFNPPFVGVPDEGAHYLRALGLAGGNIACHEDDMVNNAGLGLAEELKPVKIDGGNDAKISLGKIKKALFEKDSDELANFKGSVCGSNPIGYFPQAAGIFMADVVDAPVLWGFYLGRLFNMLASVLLIYVALRLMPFGKIVFMLVALLPMAMQQLASFSYDPLHISMIFLFSAYILRLAVGEDKITKKEMILLGASAILATNIKFGFIPVLLLLFVLPWKKFETKKGYWIFISVIIMLSVLFFYVGQKSAISSEGTREGVYPSEQIFLVLKNPLNFLFAVFNTLYDDFSFFLETFLYKPGWLRVSLPSLWYVFVLVGMVALIRSEDEKVSLQKWQRVVIGGTFLAGFFFVFFSMYVFWSKVGGEKIQGVQGRYFLAIAPLAILAFYKSNFDFRFGWIRRHMNSVASIFVIIFFFFTMISLWNLYYDKGEMKGKYLYEQQISKNQRDVAEAVAIKKSFTQTFQATKDELSGVKLYVQKGVYLGKASFYLKDEDCKEIIRKKDIGWEADEFGSMEIKFGVVTDSKNMKFCLEGDVTVEPQLFFKVFEGVYEKGEARFDDMSTNMDLIFDLIYKN